MNDFFEIFCKSIVAQLKIPRKGVLMFLLILSSILILVNKLWFHYSIAPKGSLLLQLFYGLWIFAFASIPIKAYNEYCDKKDEEKKNKEKLKSYFEMLDFCAYEEKKIFEKFYYNQTTSCNANGAEIKIAGNLSHKNIDILGCSGSELFGGKIFTSPSGLKLINIYFDKQKPEFFKLLKDLEPQEVNLLKKFVNDNDEQISLNKKEVKIAKTLISKVTNTQFSDFYIDENGFFTIPTLYLAYLDQYFSKDS